MPNAYKSQGIGLRARAKSQPLSAIIRHFSFFAAVAHSTTPGPIRGQFS
jgi:hypothetical protein